MQRIVRALGKHAIDRDQPLHRRDFRGQDDAVLRQANFLREIGGHERRLDQRLTRDGLRVDGARRLGVAIHQDREHLLIERAPVGADAHGLAVLDRHFDDGGELPVLLLLEADIAGIDAIFVERLGAGRVIGEQLVADIVEIADERRVDAHPRETVADMRHGGGRLVAVDGDAHQFRARLRERGHLPRRALDVGGIRVGHGLHDDRRAASHAHGALAGADDNAGRAVTRRRFGGDGLRQAGGVDRFGHGLVFTRLRRRSLDREPSRHILRGAVGAAAGYFYDLGAGRKSELVRDIGDVGGERGRRRFIDMAAAVADQEGDGLAGFVAVPTG